MAKKEGINFRDNFETNGPKTMGNFSHLVVKVIFLVSPLMVTLCKGPSDHPGCTKLGGGASEQCRKHSCGTLDSGVTMGDAGIRCRDAPPPKGYHRTIS